MFFLVNLCPRELKEEIVKYCAKFACVLRYTNLFNVSEKVSIDSECRIRSYAAGEGYLSLLKWEKQMKFFGICWLGIDCPVTLAAKGRHLDIMNWFQGNGYRFDEVIFIWIEKGNLDLLQWFYENGFRIIKPQCLRHARYYERQDIVEWLQSLE